MDAAAPRKAYVVTTRGRPDELFGSKAEAVQRARGREGAQVVCRTTRGSYVTRQTVWPTIGPVFTEHD